MSGVAMRRAMLLGLIFLLGVAGTLTAQNAILTYADDLDEVRLVGPSESDGVNLGQTIEGGTTIVTEMSAVELELVPSGTRIRIRANTAFVLESIQERDGVLDHLFGLAYGKFRAIATTARDYRYQVRTPAAVAGVRGTDFVQSVVPGEKDWICVRRGSVEFTNAQTNESILVRRGRFAEVYSDEFVASRAGRALIRELFADVQFSSAAR